MRRCESLSAEQKKNLSKAMKKSWAKRRIYPTKKYKMSKLVNNGVMGDGFRKWIKEEIVYLTEIKEASHEVKFKALERHRLD